MIEDKNIFNRISKSLMSLALVAVYALPANAVEIEGIDPNAAVQELSPAPVAPTETEAEGEEASPEVEEQAESESLLSIEDFQKKKDDMFKLPTGEEQPSEETSVEPQQTQAEKDVAEEIDRLNSAPEQQSEFSSLMFDEDRITKLYAIYKIYVESRSDDEEGVDQEVEDSEIYDQLIEGIQNEAEQEEEELVPSEPEPRLVIRAPAYLYMSSIINHPGKGSTYWMNGEKFSVGDDYEGIVSKRAIKNFISFEWSNLPQNIRLSKWKERAEKNAKFSASKIDIDEENNVVKFRLGSNQTFDVTKMIIREGKRITFADSLPSDNLEFFNPENVGDKIIYTTEEFEDPAADLEGGEYVDTFEGAGQGGQGAGSDDALLYQLQQLQQELQKQNSGGNSNNRDSVDPQIFRRNLFGQ